MLESSWIESHWAHGRPPNPLWQATIFSQKDGIFITLIFPEVALRRWSDVVAETLKLLRSWRME